MKEELLKGLTKEQIEKASHCKNSDELLALAKEEGVALSEEQLEHINGGACGIDPKKLESSCPQCGTMARGEYIETTPGDGKYHYICPECGFDWFEK